MANKLPDIPFDEAIVLLATLGQLTQIRVWTDHQVPSDTQYRVEEHETGSLIILPHLDVDLFGKLEGFINFLKANDLLHHIEIEVDLEDNETKDRHTVLLTNDAELIVLHTSAFDKDRIQRNLMVKWMKRIVDLQSN